MIEADLIKSILKIDPKFEVSLGDDLYLKPNHGSFSLHKYRIGPAPDYAAIEESVRHFEDVDQAVDELVDTRHKYKLGFDYEIQRFSELEND